MNGADFLETSHWSLPVPTDYNSPLFRINSSIVVDTWIILALLIALVCLARFFLYHTIIGRFIVLQFVQFFIDLTQQSLGTFVFGHCVFAASLFVFIGLCNSAPIIPWLEEPTRDLNTTLALGIIAFLYIQTATIKANGLKSYIAGFFQPFFVMLPLNIISKLSSIISISFRLFGNIFGGSIITGIYFSAIQGSLLFETLCLVSGLNILILSFFTLFEGLLQAFVFAMLTLTYLSIGTQEGGGH
jgi:F-type H+-transporting ATPase subunit a